MHFSLRLSLSLVCETRQDKIKAYITGSIYIKTEYIALHVHS